jgi:hypothetical protein
MLFAICYQCGHFDRLIDSDFFRCTKCKASIQRKQYDLAVKAGKDTSLYGFKYRTEYEKQVARHGEIVRKYSFLDPTTVEIAIACAVSVAPNAAWDGIKAVVGYIGQQLNRRRLKNRSLSSGLGPCSEDLIFVKNLLEDQAFRERYMTLVAEYNANKGSPTPGVAEACNEEKGIKAIQRIVRDDPPHYVYATKSASRFHRKKCAFAGKRLRKLRIKAAVEDGMSPCRKCRPDVT